MFKTPRLIGHRGARMTAPENTLAGIRQGHQEGATWVEFDVKLTADNVPILMHDETVERTTDGSGAVAGMTLAAIKKLDAGIKFDARFKGERVPTLVDTLALMASLGMGFNLEVKPCPGRERETALVALETVRKHWPSGGATPIFSSFKAASLAAVRDAAPEMPRGYLAESLGPDWRREAEMLGCRFVHPGQRGLTQAQVAAVKAAGFPVLVWTVNDAARGRELLSWGADSLITDCPAALARGLA